MTLLNVQYDLMLKRSYFKFMYCLPHEKVTLLNVLLQKKNSYDSIKRTVRSPSKKHYKI